jgi:cytoskeleton protein RodZ
VTETVLMGSFGENLRREREMRGVTLEEISAATKISVRFLKSIENEDFSKLPGGLFNRSFVRAYARYLGLEEDTLLAEYQLAAKAKGEVDVTRLSFPVSHSPRPRSSRSTWIGAAAAVVLLVAGYAIWRYSRGPTPAERPEARQAAVQPNAPNPATTSNAQKPASPVGTPPPAAATAPPPSTSSSVGAQAENQPTTQPPAATPAPPGAQSQEQPNPDYANNLVLQIATTERSWVAIDADGKTIMQGIMNPNEVKTFKAKESFDVLTGNARGMVLTLNGQTLKPLGREGEVKSVHLGWDDVKNQKSP